jgi:hypothetical protein
MSASTEREERLVTTKLLEELLTAAKAHGDESDAEHEVGDLQGLLSSCWARLTPAQRRDVYVDHEELVTEWHRGR